MADHVKQASGLKPNGPCWPDDILDRSSTGRFLYKVVTQRFGSYHAAPESGALCVALDAEWGAGKTFFVKHWSKDIENSGHLVIRFDAWQNDLADDPLLAFMAQVQEQLVPSIKSLPMVAKVKDKAGEYLRDLLEKAPQAVLPALLVLGKGLGKKLFELDTDELAASVLAATSSKEAKEMTAEALQKFFEVATRSHSEKQKAIKSLKSAIEKLLAFLEKEQKTRLPLFIFIDELDRCRPNYAVRLLEGVKHLFDAQGICFVFSTNLPQLSAATQAVYGPAFDGYGYLKRFFNARYVLPEPDHQAFAKALVSKSTLIKSRKLVQCMPPVIKGAGTADDPSALDELAREFAVVAQAFRLDLRAQEQVYRFAEAAGAGLPDGLQLCALYLFALCAAFQKSPELFELMSNRNESIDEALRQTKTVNLQYQFFDSQGRQSFSGIPLNKIISTLHTIGRKSWADIVKALQQSNSDEFPFSLHGLVYQENGQNSAKKRERPSLAQYHEMVSTAGRYVPSK